MSSPLATPNQKSLEISAGAVGVVLKFALIFTHFDPAGASAKLWIAEPHGFGLIPLRDMTLVGAMASYTVQAGEFENGFYDAQVRVSKNGVTVSSETFTLAVRP